MTKNMEVKEGDVVMAAVDMKEPAGKLELGQPILEKMRKVQGEMYSYMFLP